MAYLILPREFFRRSVLEVAPDLLGKLLVRGERRAAITEVEAYEGSNDLASHASRGRTARNEVMFQAGGVWYVYLCYGMHWMLNIVTGEKDYPSAVLIRGVQNLAGPGRLTKYFQIDQRFNSLPAMRKSGLYLAEDKNLKSPKLKILSTPRIGVAYAGPIWSQKPWRFLLEDR